MDGGKPARGRRWRIVGWSMAALAFLLPLAAMQVTDAVDWGAGDFVVAGALVLGVGLAYELAVRATGSGAYRAAAAMALAAAFVLVWVNLAVGVIGSEGDPANLMYGVVLAVGVAGAALARGRPKGMARALVAAALAQAAVAAIALGAGLDATPPLDAGFAALWLASAWLFRKAAREGAAV
jgi:hypothetical protein